MEIVESGISRCGIWRKHILIFVCTGSRNYQFDRLLKKLDELVLQQSIKEEIYAQIGKSNYHPKAFSYVNYVDTDEFEELQKNARIVITHGGVGTIVSALKKEKTVIGVPRLKMYEEHIDDHQVQIVKVFEEKGYIKAVYNMDDLMGAIRFFDEGTALKKYSGNSEIINIIDDFLKI